jgi:hypothetical protein
VGVGWRERRLTYPLACRVGSDGAGWGPMGQGGVRWGRVGSDGAYMAVGLKVDCEVVLCCHVVHILDSCLREASGDAERSDVRPGSPIGIRRLHDGHREGRVEGEGVELLDDKSGKESCNLIAVEQAPRGRAVDRPPEVKDDTVCIAVDRT